MSQKFAVFDIDGTIFRSSLFLEMTYRAIKAGIIAETFDNEITEVRDAWLKRKDSEAYDTYITEAVASFRRHIVGVKVKDIQQIAKQTVDEFHEHTYVFTRDLIHTLKKEDYFLIAITGSPEEIAHEFTKRYDFDFLKSTHMVSKNGKYLGVDRPADGDKQAELKKIITANGLSYSGSFAIGDTGNDASMLQLVESPIAFNPDKKLFKIADENGWQIVVERKNMFYKLQKGPHGYVLAETRVF